MPKYLKAILSNSLVPLSSYSFFSLITSLGITPKTLFSKSKLQSDTLVTQERAQNRKRIPSIQYTFQHSMASPTKQDIFIIGFVSLSKTQSTTITFWNTLKNTVLKIIMCQMQEKNYAENNYVLDAGKNIARIANAVQRTPTNRPTDQSTNRANIVQSAFSKVGKQKAEICNIPLSL